MQRHDPEHGVPVGKPLGAALAPEKGTRKVKKGTVTRFDDDEEEDGKTADAKPAADAGADSAQPAKKAKREEEASSAKEADKAEPATADEADTGAPPSKRRKRKAGKA